MASLDDSSSLSSSLEETGSNVPETEKPETHEKVDKVLESFGLSELIETFKSNGIDVECLHLMVESDIVQLIPQINLRMKFRSQLNEWREKKVSSHHPKPSSFDSKQFNILNVLNSTDTGKSVILHYKKEGSFDETVRRSLIKSVIDYCVENKFSLGTKECSTLADKIVAQFPNENKLSYFISASNKKNAKGSLYTKYNNTLSFYRNKGLIDRPTKSVTSSTLPKSDETLTSLEEDKEFLHKYNKPWDLVTQKWERTFDIRRDELFSSTSLKVFYG